MNKKRLIFMFVLPIIIVCVFSLRNYFLLNTISGLIHIRDKLGRLYLQRVNLRLASNDEQIVDGETEKYVLIDNNGKKWIFKVDLNAQERMRSLIAYHLANILGVNVPPMYEFNLTINDNNLKGVLIEMLPSETKFVHSTDRLIVQNNNHLNSSIINIVFGWWLFGETESSEIELAITPLKKIYHIDMNNALHYDNFFLSGNHEQFYDHLYKGKLVKFKNIDIDFKKAHRFVQHSINIQNNKLRMYLRSYLDSFDEQFYFNDIDIVIDRKNNLSKNYRKLFAFHPNYSDKNFNHSDIFSYRLSINGDLLKNILRQIQFLMFMKISDKKNNINIVSSRLAWIYLNRYTNLLDEDEFTEFDQAISQMDKNLTAMRYGTPNLREKIAITLYLRQIRTCKHYFDKHDYSMKYDNEAWIMPIVQNIHISKYHSIADQWYSRIKYMHEDAVPIMKKKGEDEYIAGLINLINNQQDKSMRLLLTALEKGYAVDEVDKIITTHISHLSALTYHN